MTQVPLVMTIIGPDRPGLVQLLADRIAEHGGSWLESRMALLGGQFAGILRVAVPEQTRQALVTSLHNLSSEGVTVAVHSGIEARSPAQYSPRAILEIVGHDRPGIVRQISQILALRNVNVDELETKCVSAPMSGEPLFKATAVLDIPVTCNCIELRDELQKIAQELMADISLITAA